MAKTQGVRELLLERLADWSAFATAAPAQGAFYLLLKVNGDLPSLELTRRLIEEYKVAVIPGSAFGLTESCYLRIAYGILDLPTCGEALDRLESGLIALAG
jgi:aspartate/methionine/tyrosine aminotransferase